MAIRSALSNYIFNEEQDGFVAVDFDFIIQEDHLDLTAWEFVDPLDSDVDDCSSDAEDSDCDCVGFGGCDAETVIGSDVESSPEYFVGEDDDDDCSGDDVSDHFGFSGLFVSDMLEECAGERIVDGDANSVTETIVSPEYSDDSIFNEDSKSAEYCCEEEEDDYDLDDELVPYCVNGKLGRDRMRKLGKRSCAKSVKSKRLTYNYNKAGCFRGKHGLGLKHSLM